MLPKKLWVGVTDEAWFEYLSSRPDLDEVNFWLPLGSRPFKVLQPGEPFLFKLHAPNNFIVGGGFFEKSTSLPVNLAWEVFAEKNGAASLEEMRGRIAKYRRRSRGLAPSLHDSYEIGCLLLLAPFFWNYNDWLPAPRSWSPNLVTGKSFSTEEPEGRELWEQVQARLRGDSIGDAAARYEEAEVYGEPILVHPRLGQGTFRVLITDTYERRCAATGEKALPVLEAAHIKPLSKGGIHRIDNGILLRSDLHRLFDLGYLGIGRDHSIHVSRRLKSEFGNGEIYYPLDGQKLWVPNRIDRQPNPELLEWHADTVFRP